MKSLTHRQERFCHAFVHWANGAEAAREAGYTVRSARKQASVMLQTVRIRARIHEIQTKLAEDAGADMAALIGKLEIIYRRAIGDRGHGKAMLLQEIGQKGADVAIVIDHQYARTIHSGGQHIG